MRSTIYPITGMATPADARAVQAALRDVRGIGGVATEIVPEGDSRIIVKHEDHIKPDRDEIAAVLQKAGDYRLS